MTPTPSDPRDQISRFSGCLFEPADLVEIRMLPSKRSEWLPAADLPGLAPRDGENVYVGANPRRAVGDTDTEGVALARCLFVDFDGGATVEQALERVRAAGLPPPTVIIHSGHGVHCYWRLTEPMHDLVEWTGRQRALIAVLGTDPVIHDPPRIMRLPGFLNRKYDPAVPAVLAEAHPNRRCSLGLFPAALPSAAVGNPARALKDGSWRSRLARTSMDFLLNGAPEGERNDRLFRAACDAAGCGAVEAEAAAELGQAARRCGLSEAEIKSTVASAFAKSRSPSRPGGSGGGADTTPAGAVVAGGCVSAPAAGERFSPFPVDVLPEPVRTFVVETSRAIGCDPSYIALPLLVALASAIGNTRRIRLKRKWSEPAILWGALVGKSGSTKTPALEAALEAVRKVQAEAFNVHNVAYANWEAANLKHAAAMTAWRKKAAEDPGSAGEPPAEPERPTPRRVMTSDTTTEAIAPILLDNQRGMLVANDELAGWIGGFDRYAGGRVGADAARWLSMHNGGALLIDRKDKDNPTISVPAAVVSVIGSIQPGILRRALGQQHRDNGLAARLLLAYPPARERRWTEDDLSAQAEAAIAHLFDVLYALEGDPDEGGVRRPRLLPLSADAKRVWVAFFNRHGQEQAALSEDLAAAWSKLEAYAPRFALIIHLARCAAGDPSLVRRDEVDEVSMSAGVALADWFGGEARRVYAMLDETDEERRLRELEELVRRVGTEMTVRELMRGCRAFKTVDEAEAALNALVKARRGVWLVSPMGAAGGAPTKRFRFIDDGGADTTPDGGSAGGGSVSSPDPEAGSVNTAREGTAVRPRPATDAASPPHPVLRPGPPDLAAMVSKVMGFEVRVAEVIALGQRFDGEPEWDVLPGFARRNQPSALNHRQ